MNLRRIHFAAAALALLAGCESNYENRYPFDNAAYIDLAKTTSENNVTFKKTVTEVDRELAAELICPAKEELTVTFTPDPSRVAGYNAGHDTDYAMLDEAYYEFTERTAVVEAGKSRSEALVVRFKQLDQLEIDRTYLFPVSIASAGGGLPTLSGSGTIYFLVRRSSAITTAAVLTDNWIAVPGFDKPGSSDCVNGLKAVTYEAIVRMHDFHYGGPTSTYIEEKLSTIMGVEQHLLLRIGDTNYYAEQIQVDGSGVSLGKFPEKSKAKLLSLEEWYHIAFTYDLVTGIGCIYVNGQLQSKTQVSPTVQVINLALRPLDPDPETDARQFFIGYSYDDYRQLCGDISEVRVWSVARTQEEIWRDMYDVENPAEKPELRAYWKFNEGQGNTVKDWSMYGNDAVSHTDLKWNTSVEIPQLNKQE